MYRRHHPPFRPGHSYRLKRENSDVVAELLTWIAAKEVLQLTGAVREAVETRLAAVALQSTERGLAHALSSRGRAVRMCCAGLVAHAF